MSTECSPRRGAGPAISLGLALNLAAGAPDALRQMLRNRSEQPIRRLESDRYRAIPSASIRARWVLRFPAFLPRFLRAATSQSPPGNPLSLIPVQPTPASGSKPLIVYQIFSIKRAAHPDPLFIRNRARRDVAVTRFENKVHRRPFR